MRRKTLVELLRPLGEKISCHMPNVTAPGLTLPARAQTGGNPVGTPAGFLNELLVSELMAKYSTLAKLGVLQVAYATLTAPTIFSTAAATGGPLIWNKPNSTVDAHILAAGFSTSVVTTVAGGLGLTGNAGQAVAPLAVTAIDAIGNPFVGGGLTKMGGVYRVGTPLQPGNIFLPFAQVHTGALTVDTTALTWVDLGGCFIIPPGSWGSVAGSATLTTLQVQMALLWAELPT